MTKKMLIDAAHPEEVRVALLSGNKIEDFDFESAAKKPLRGNIFLARVTRVEPSLQAAFVDYGGNRHGFLAFSEIHPDYYQIPVSDREALQRAEAEVAELAEQLELDQRGDDEDDDLDEVAMDDRDGDGAVEAAEEPEGQAEKPKRRRSRRKKSADIDADANEEEEEEERGENEVDAPFLNEKAEVEGESSGADENQADDDQSADEAGETDEGDAETPEARDDGAAQKKQSKPSRQALFEQYKDAKRRRSQLLRNYKIQEVIKRRQILLIQVVKEERGNKGAALTTYLSLAGRYCVLMPNTARGGGISRKIAHGTDRRRLKRVVESLDVPRGMGLIIRTAGAKRTKTEIKRDYDYLLRLWENIRVLTLKSIAPCLIYEEASLIKRAIRDLYDKDISKVMVEGEAGYREAKDFMKMLMPSHAKNVQPYKDREPIFLRYQVEDQLDGMYQPTVRLKSGGYLVIHQTEALIAIDVNSGRSTRERNIEQTALKTNLEAAEEAARQFRLRDLAGLIVLDFIDMEEQRNNKKVEKALKDAMKNDRARVQVGRISSFGLLELSRQRRRSGIVDGTTHACPTCAGAGVIRSYEMAALRILRAIEGEAIDGKAGLLTVHASADVALHILNKNRDWLARIENDNGVKVEILADREKHGDAYDLEKSGTPAPRDETREVVRADQKEAVEAEPVDEDQPDGSEARGDVSERDGDGERGGRRRRRRPRKPDQREQGAQARETSDDHDDGEAESAEAKRDGADNDDADGEDGARKKRRRRGRRGGRRNRRDAKPADDNAEASDGGDATADAKSEPDDNEADGDQANGDAARKRGRANGAATEEDNDAMTDAVAAQADTQAASKTAASAGADQPSEARTGAGESDRRDDEIVPAPPAEPEPAEASSPEETVDDEASDKPKRTGWWRRAAGS